MAKTPEKAEKMPLRLEWIEAGSLIKSPLNWRKYGQEQPNTLKEMAQDVGWAAACLDNERTKRLIDGHACGSVVDPRTPIPGLVGSRSAESKRNIRATLEPVGMLASGDVDTYVVEVL